jgi:ribosomal protein S18 acetylase RimI-like enzyme
MEDLQFDPVTPDDADALLEMARAFHLEDGHPLSIIGEAAVRRVALGEPLARCWIIRRRGVVSGYVVITLGYSIEYGGRDGYIDDLYLVAEARGDGCGRRLLDFALEQARLLGIGTLHLEVDPVNERAFQLYRRRGFEDTGRRLLRLQLGDRP